MNRYNKHHDRKGYDRRFSYYPSSHICISPCTSLYNFYLLHDRVPHEILTIISKHVISKLVIFL